MSELVVAAPSGASPSVVAPTAITDGGAADDAPPGAAARVAYLPFKGEFQMAEIVALIERDLSEPYSVFTYRYFIWQWPHMCLLAHADERIVGVIIAKIERHREQMRGYVAMLAVDRAYRRLGVGRALVTMTIERMRAECDEVVLETEASNAPALALYESLGFVRDKRLAMYYLNGGDAFRLKLWLKPPALLDEFYLPPMPAQGGAT